MRHIKTYKLFESSEDISVKCQSDTQYLSDICQDIKDDGCLVNMKYARVGPTREIISLEIEHANMSNSENLRNTLNMMTGYMESEGYKYLISYYNNNLKGWHSFDFRENIHINIGGIKQWKVDFYTPYSKNESQIFERMGVPDVIFPYTETIYKNICQYLDKYFESKSTKSYGKQIPMTFDISDEKYQIKKATIELLIYHNKSDNKMPFMVGATFHKNRSPNPKNDLRLTLEVYLNKQFTTGDISDLKYRTKQVINHELLHSYEFIQSGGVSMNANFHNIVNHMNDLLNRGGNKENHNLIRKVYNEFFIPLYQSLPQEVRAAVAETADISSMDELLKTKTWTNIQRMKNFDSDKLYQKIENIEGFYRINKSFGDNIGSPGKSLKDVMDHYQDQIREAGETIRRKVLKRIKK